MSKKWSIFLILGIVVAASISMFGCLGGDDDDDEEETGDTNTTTAPRMYRGSLSQGDLMTIIICENNHTIWYQNLHTGESGWVNYTVNSDGSYNVTAPDGKILKAVEMAGYAVIAYFPQGSNDSLIVALNLTTATESDLSGNYTFLYHRPGETTYGLAEGYGNGTITVTSAISISPLPLVSFESGFVGPNPCAVPLL